MTKVTIFIPVYNAEKYITKTIKSILDQTYTNFELLIINDGSTDNTIKKIKEFNDERLVIIENNKNEGLPYTRNRGLYEAKGDYIALIDADDIAYPERIEEQVKYLDNNQNVIVVGSLYDYIIDDEIKKIKHRKKNKDLKEENTILDINIMFGTVLNNPTTMFRKKEILKHNINYRNECFIAQDYAFWIDCKQKGYFHIIQKSLSAYRIGHDNISRISTQNKSEKRRYIIDNLRKCAIENNKFIFNEYEMSVFNKVFSDPINVLNFEDFVSVKIVLNNFILQNKKLNFADEKIFSETIKYNFVSKITTSNLNFTKKIKLILYKFDNESWYSIIKNLLRLLKKR